MVALTGWGQGDARRRTGEAGFDHHLVKPVELSSWCAWPARGRTASKLQAAR